MVGDLEVTHEMMELLDELLQVGDGYFGRVVIHDRDEGKKLEAHGLAFRSNRGSYHAGPKLSDWIATHSTAVYHGLNESRRRAYPFGES